MSSLPILAPRPPGGRHSDIEPSCSKEHTEAEWEVKKELIEKLYIRENRKLNETMTILECKHGFAAT